VSLYDRRRDMAHGVLEARQDEDIERMDYRHQGMVKEQQSLTLQEEVEK